MFLLPERKLVGAFFKRKFFPMTQRNVYDGLQGTLGDSDPAFLFVLFHVPCGLHSPHMNWNAKEFGKLSILLAIPVFDKVAVVTRY